MVLIIAAVAHHVTENLNRFRNAIREALHVVDCEFAARVRIQMRAHVFNFDLQLVTGTLRRALEVQMLQEVSRTRRVLGLITTASLNEDADCRDGARVVGLCDDSDAILNPSDLHWTIVFERCWDLASGQITEVLRSGSLAELESSFGL